MKRIISPKSIESTMPNSVTFSTVEFKADPAAGPQRV
jgi:hypothetical protein